MCVSPQRLPEMAEGRRGLFLERLVVDPPDLADKRAEKEALPLATSAVDDSYPWAGGWALSESKEVAPLVVAIEEALGSKLVHSVPSEVVTGLTVTRPTTMSRSTQRPTCGHEKSPPRSHRGSLATRARRCDGATSPSSSCSTFTVSLMVPTRTPLSTGRTGRFGGVCMMPNGLRSSSTSSTTRLSAGGSRR